MLVPLPRHIYGELARTLDGCQFLAEKSIVSDLIATVHRENISQEELSAALWSLGNIASTELGFLPILNADPEFVEWCIYNTQHNQNFSIRSTFFYVIGLLSRTARGASRLDKCDWDTSPIGSNSAVAVPRNPSTLFVDGLSGYKPLKTGQSLRKTKAAKTIEKLRRDGNVSGKLMNGSEHSSDISNPSSINVSPPASVAFLSPSVNAQYASIEIEILNLIVKVFFTYYYVLWMEVLSLQI